jgi:hypothetical protein
MLKYFIIVIGCLLVLSCQNQRTDSNLELGKYYSPDDALELEEELELEPPRTAEPPATPNYSLEKGSKIIKNGSMKFEVTELELAKSKVDTILKTCNGYYENEQFNSYGNRISYSLQLRIPNSKFDSLIAVIEAGVGELNSKNINAKDVTEEYVDLNIRLENNLAYLNQYKEILKKAKSVKEILEVQEKIRRIEEEINSKKGRLKYLDDKVKYSTLHLELTELIKSEISNRPKFTTRLTNAFNNGFHSFLSFVIGLISLWPFLIVILVLILGRKPILNKLNFRKRNTPPNNR